MKRLKRIPIPKEIIENGREREIMGDTRLHTMIDCTYNNMLTPSICKLPDYDKGLAEYKISELHLPVQLKPYQIEDICQSLNKSLVFNINKPGCGKTLETIIWMRLKLTKKSNILILCPKSVIETWREQLKRYWSNYKDDVNIFIFNYEYLYNTEHFNVIKDTDWNLIVLDESHKIKSMKSKITGLVFQLKSDYRHCLTGTPIKNRPQDLAPQLKWLDPNSITNYTDFTFCFCDMIRDAWGWHANGLTKNKTMVHNLQQLLDYYCVGGQEHSIGNLSKPEYIKVRLHMDPKVKRLYQKVVGEYDKQLNMRVIDTQELMNSGIKVTNAIESAVRRQQLTSNPQHFDIQLKNVKFEWISDWLEGTDEKVVIFSKYAQSIKALEDYLLSKKFTVSVVRKEQNSEIRQQVIEQWGLHNQVLLGTFGVLGTGVDSLQHYCHYIIFLDREWDASDNEQAEGRVYRTGQTKPVVIYILQAIGTIDVKIEQVQNDKGHDVRTLLEPVSDDSIE